MENTIEVFLGVYHVLRAAGAYDYMISSASAGSLRPYHDRGRIFRARNPELPSRTFT